MSKNSHRAVDEDKGRFPEKSSCSFGFCSNYLDPPPNLYNFYHFFKMPMCQKISAEVSPSLPIPKLTQYIQFKKSGQKIWAGPPLPHLDKAIRTATFFRETFPKLENQNIICQHRVEIDSSMIPLVLFHLILLCLL